MNTAAGHEHWGDDNMSDIDGDAYYAALGAGEYDPDAPTYPDPNSREAAAEAQEAGTIRTRRRFVCERVGAYPGMLSCWDFCEGTLKEAGHGAVSGTINSLWRYGLVQRVGRRRNGRGHHEYLLSLHPNLVGHLSEVDWDQPVADIASDWGTTAPPKPESPDTGVPPTPQEEDRFSSLIDEVAESDLLMRCTRCGHEARLSTLSSRFGVPQYLNHMGGAAIWEVTCPDKSCPSRKRLKHAMEALYREVKS